LVTSAQKGAHALYYLASFAVKCMFLIPRTILIQFYATRCVSFILNRSIITSFALGASKQDIYTHRLLHNRSNNTSAYGTATFTDSKA